MQRTYLNSNQVVKAYDRGKSYINEYIEKDESKYFLLPEEYDIFTEIDLSNFYNIQSPQSIFLAKVLNRLRANLRDIVSHGNTKTILPKLNLFIDEDEAYVLNWAYVNYRIYFNIEKDIEESYYGIVSKNIESDLFSRTGKFNENNMQKIISELLNYVCQNS